ncbi:hypothetical protein V8C37DRAFT_373782 [Trichoderma ceciliae]
MYATRLVQVLVAAVSILCMVQATWWDAQKIHHRGLLRRADAISDLTGDVTSSPSVDNPTSSSTPPAKSSSTPPPQVTSDTPSSTSASPSSTPTTDASSSTSSPGGDKTTTPASTPADSTTAGPSGSSTSSGASAPASTTPPPDAKSSDGSDGDSSSGGGSKTSGGDGNNAAAPTTTPPPVVSTKIEVVIKTNTDGSKSTETTTTKTTQTASLNAEDSKPTGMTVKTRNTIIGVVVGIGGAFILGALGLVAFRVWGRRKHAEEADGLMAYNVDISAAEKSPRGSSSGGPRNPFQSTLENYHQPVNASANF